MLTPERIRYEYPARLSASEVPYQIDTADFLEAGETLVGATITTVAGSTVPDRIGINGSVVTFWLSGGQSERAIHTIKIVFETNLGESEAMLVEVPVIG